MSLRGYTRASLKVIAKEANPEHWVTVLRCPREGDTFRVVWHCSMPTWASPYHSYVRGYAIKSIQVKDL